ncbi:hypothetical protein SO802_033830 [Lithocarpus litseifolius]|uniref:Uncharacterized protein n=1 Tax=Lithocarpus litseifolius TaxID=425828 RepID=A0AAW2BE55_9ROSI
MVKYSWFKLNSYFDDHRNKSIEQLNSGKKWCQYALDIFMRNKGKAEHHRVMRLSAQQQKYQVDTLHNPGTIGHGDHTHGVNLLQRTCTCQKWKLVDALFRSYALVFPALKDRLSWPDPNETRKVLPNPRLIREKGRPVSTRIRNEMDEGGKRPRTTPWKEGGGRCNAGCVNKRGITEEHALSRMRYRRVVVSQTSAKNYCQSAYCLVYFILCVDVDMADKNLKVLGWGRCYPGRHLFPSLRARYVLSNRVREKMFPCCTSDWGCTLKTPSM